MDRRRRKFIEQVTVMSGLAALSPALPALSLEKEPVLVDSGPWLELSAQAYLRNAKTISQLANDKPVLAVLKNNAYGIGDIEVAGILDKSEAIAATAYVKDARALAVSRSGVKKPVLLMGDFHEELGPDLARQEVILSIYSKETFRKISRLHKKLGRTINVALYLDTGLGRMGLPVDQVSEVARKLAKTAGLKLKYTFSTLTTPKDFARQQIDLFKNLVMEIESHGMSAGETHLAPSYSILDLPESHMDIVRPGILVHGSYPSAHSHMSQDRPLEPTYRLKAPVMRLEKLKAGDTIGFSRFYKVTKDEWIATLPIGWADGYYSGAENGAKALLAGKLVKVVNVNGSHTNLSLGDNTNVKVGDVATLIGPDHPEITPEGFGKLVKSHNYLQINYKESLPKFVYDKF